MQPNSARRRLPRRWPIATVSVLTVTAVLTVLQYPFPQVRLALWRDPGALTAGQWRLVTPLFVQYDAVWQILVVFACIAGVGVLAERIFGHGPPLLVGFGLGGLLLWLDRRRVADDRAAVAAGPGPGT
jgi:hypothetical protein